MPASFFPQDAERFGREVAKLIGVMLALALLGSVLAVVLAWAVARLFGQEVTGYPWHVVLLIDLGFMLLSAVLAEWAEEQERPSGGRTWTSASFIVSVGTLAPLAAHAGKTWRDVFELRGSLQEPTILSQVLCAQFGAGCGEQYFWITIVLTILCCLLAFIAAIMQRRTTQLAPGIAIFTVSVVLFAVYTLINQKWDVPAGTNLPPITALQGVQVVAIILGVIGALVLAGVFIVSWTSRTGRAARVSWAAVQRASWLRRLLILLAAILGAILLWAVILTPALALLSLLESAVPDWLRREEWLRLALEHLRRFANLSLVALVILGVAAAVLALLGAWFRPTEPADGREPENDEEEVPDGETPVVYPDPPIVPSPAPNLFRQLLASIASVVRTVAHRVADVAVRCWTAVADMSRDVAKATWRVMRWIGERRRAGVAGLALVCCLLIIVLVRAPSPYGGMGGKAALAPSGSGFAKAGFPALSFAHSRIICPDEYPLAWAHGEVDRVLTASRSQSCSLSRDVRLPCWAASIVVAGTASMSANIEAEKQRARDRGESLARILARDFAQRCGNEANLYTYVLNLGPYSGESYRNDPLAQRTVFVLVGGGESETTEDTVAAVEAITSREARFAEYANCDLYYLNQSGGMSLVRALKCGTQP